MVSAVLSRASGTVYTAIDIATGQEVSSNIHPKFLWYFLVSPSSSVITCLVDYSLIVLH